MHGDIAHLNGIRVHYHVEGHGPDVLFVHGWSSSRRMWAHITPALSRSHRSWSLDLPGYGDSDKPEDAWYSIPNYTDILRHFVEAMGLRRPHVIGHSMGGLIALDFAATHPERVNRLVVINPVVTGRAYMRHLADWARGVQVIDGFQRLSRRVVRPVLSHPLSQNLHYQVKRLHRRNDEFTQATPEALMGSGRATVGYDVRPKLRHITAPALVVLSTLDVVVPNSEGHLAAVEIPNARLIVMNGGHTLMDDRPSATVRLIREFLA